MLQPYISRPSRSLTAKFLILVAVVACSSLIAISQSDIPETVSGCILPPTNLAFPLWATRDLNTPQPTPVFPPRTWEPQLTIDQSKEIGIFANLKIITARSSDDIWLMTTGEKIVRFQPSQKHVTVYDSHIENGAEAYIYEIRAGKGALWATGSYVERRSGTLSGFLSQYDPVTDQFVFVPEALEALGDMSPKALRVDAQGVVWLADGYVLIRFDPATRLMTRMLDLEPNYRFDSFTITYDGTIWMTAWSFVTGGPRWVVLSYTPSSGQLREYTGVRNQEYHPTVYFDRSRRLWISDYGWFDFSSSSDGIWYEVIRSEVFVHDRAGPEFQYGWARPYMIYESSDGIMWFSSTAGVASLDPKTSEWCLITTLQGPVEEDDAHNLWIAGEGQIYRYKLKDGLTR